MQLRYSITLLLGDLVDEIGFAITEGLFDEEGQKVLRRVAKRAMDARSLVYELGQPQPEPPKPVEYTPPTFEPTTKTIH